MGCFFVICSFPGGPWVCVTFPELRDWGALRGGDGMRQVTNICWVICLLW